MRMEFSSHFCVSQRRNTQEWASYTFIRSLPFFALFILAFCCLYLLCKSHLCFFSARARAWKSWYSHIPQIEAQRGTLPPGAGFKVQSDWYSKTLRARRHISGSCEMRWRFWKQALRAEKSIPSDLSLLISFMWVVSAWNPN